MIKKKRTYFVELTDFNEKKQQALIIYINFTSFYHKLLIQIRSFSTIILRIVISYKII